MVATGEDERSERLLGESSPELGTCLVAREDEHRCEKAKELRSSPKLHSSVARALQRPRLLRALGRLDGRKLGLVIAPAGWGKTILLGQYAAAHDGPVAWCASHGAPETFEARVCAVVAEMTNQTGVGGVVEYLSAALATCSGQSALVVIDDVHLISGTTAERVLEKLIAHSPPGVVVLAAGRSRPALDLSLLRVQDEVVEVGPEELRFRVWEVERLFSEVYGEALLPEASAQLARRTEGWPACLQLFHLATSGMSPSRRALVLENLPAWRARLVKGYLTRHILEELPQDIRAFLIRTSVLPRPTGPLCDMLLGRTGSEQVLEELERRQLFTQRIDQAGVFCYHEVLRSYLEAELHSLVGERGLCSHYREAGDLLASEGRMEEALWCYARAGEEDLVAKLAATSGRVLPGVESPWMEVLPAGGLSSDPWLCLGRARQALGQGRLEEALKAYRDGTLAGE
ncbi:MAG: hypothetical protein M1115_01175, partial [Actinobacteria bacterium]|nr:hypothetical protein [Actinomycetota bacterium]